MARIIVVDADRWVAKMLASALESRAHEVRLAESATLAMQLLQDEGADCLIADVNLSEGSGFDLATQIRSQDSEIAGIAVLLLSRDGSLEVSLKAFRAGADTLWTKPFAVEELVAQVDAMMRMAQRMGGEEAGESEPPSSQPRPARDAKQAPSAVALAGPLEALPLRTLFGVLERESRTGTVSLAAKRSYRFSVASGRLVGASVGDAKAQLGQALRAALREATGRVEFRNEVPRDAPAYAKSWTAALASDIVPSSSVPDIGGRSSGTVEAPVEIETDFDSYRPPS